MKQHFSGEAARRMARERMEAMLKVGGGGRGWLGGWVGGWVGEKVGGGGEEWRGGSHPWDGVYQI